MIAGALIAGFVSINRHYREVAGQLSLDGYAGPPPMQHTVLVLVGDLHKGIVQALQYARTLSPSAKAVYVEMDPEKTRRLEEKWGKWGFGVPLVVLTSPYRLLLSPLLEYVDHLLALGENHMVTIVIPEFIPAKWWQQLLHNQTALVIKGALPVPPQRGRDGRAVSPAPVAPERMSAAWGSAGAVVDGMSAAWGSAGAISGPPHMESLKKQTEVRRRKPRGTPWGWGLGRAC